MTTIVGTLYTFMDIGFGGISSIGDQFDHKQGPKGSNAMVGVAYTPWDSRRATPLPLKKKPLQLARLKGFAIHHSWKKRDGTAAANHYPKLKGQLLGEQRETEKNEPKDV